MVKTDLTKVRAAGVPTMFSKLITSLTVGYTSLCIKTVQQHLESTTLI